MADFSFSQLSIEDDELPARGKGAELNPQFVEALKSSYAGRTAVKGGTWVGSAKSLRSVPAEKVSEVVALIYNAAQSLGYGTRVDYLSPATGARLTRESVGGKPLVRDGKPVMRKDGKTPRLTGGKTQFKTANGSRHTGAVKVTFAAKTPRQTEKRQNS